MRNVSRKNLSEMDFNIISAVCTQETVTVCIAIICTVCKLSVAGMMSGVHSVYQVTRAAVKRCIRLHSNVKLPILSLRILRASYTNLSYTLSLLKQLAVSHFIWVLQKLDVYQSKLFLLSNLCCTQSTWPRIAYLVTLDAVIGDPLLPLWAHIDVWCNKTC